MFSSLADSSGDGQFFKAPLVDFGSLSIGTGFSICTWLRFDGIGSWSRVFDFGNGPGQGNIILAQNGESSTLSFVRWQVCNNINTYYGFNFPVGILYSQWRHVCVMNKGIRWTYYDNGALVGSDQTCGLTSDPLFSNYLGRSNWNPDRLFQGGLAEFRIYSRSLSLAEVQAIYAYRGAYLEEEHRV